MSERGGWSDVERLRIWIFEIDFEIHHSISRPLQHVVCRIRLFPSLSSKIKWLGFELSLIQFYQRDPRDVLIFFFERFFVTQSEVWSPKPLINQPIKKSIDQENQNESHVMWIRLFCYKIFQLTGDFIE